MAYTKFVFQNEYTSTKRRFALLEPNSITILVGKNGYGKTSFLKGLKRLADSMDNALIVDWNDNEYGRSQGMSRMSLAEDFEGLASMIGRSEGERMVTSLSRYLLGKAGRTIGSKEENHDTIFLLIDQIDSGLDVAQINKIKNIIRKDMIPDMNKRGLTVYVVMSANSYEMVINEDCMDPITRKHMKFKTFEEYKDHIQNQYDPEDEE